MPIHRLINRIPIQNENLRIFVGACIFTGIICIPKAMGGSSRERLENRVAFYHATHVQVQDQDMDILIQKHRKM